MEIKIGDKVISKIHTDKGIGDVVKIQKSLFDKDYADVLFSDNERCVIDIRELSLIKFPFDRLSDSDIDNPYYFKLLYLNEKIDELLLDSKLISSLNFKVEPLPHQLLAIDFAMALHKPRCLIADEVGLGKTIEAILIYEELKLRNLVNRVLIITPSALTIQWQQELLYKFNENFVIYNSNLIKSLVNTYGEHSNIWKANDKIIASIDMIKPYKIHDALSKKQMEKREWHNKYIYEDLGESNFDLLIIDEAHKLTKKEGGKETARYKLGKYLTDKIPMVLLLTATPHQGDEHTFLHLLQLLDNVSFNNLDSLNPSNLKEITIRNKKRAVVDFNNNRIFKHRITKLIELIRTESENSIELKLYDLITDYTRDYYNLAKKLKNRGLVFLTILYQRICSSSSFALQSTLEKRKLLLEDHINKLKNYGDNVNVEDADDMEEMENIMTKNSIWTEKADIEKEILLIDECLSLSKKLTSTYGDIKLKKLLEKIEEIKSNKDNPDLKFLIFTEFKATQKGIIDYLILHNYSCCYINGDLSNEKKIVEIEKFRNNAQILVSTDAGGEGINLQFCYCMINYDLPWNPTKLEQRIGRLDRIGQKNNVIVFNFQIKGTVEDKVRTILENKLLLIKEQFGEDKYSDVITLLQDDFKFEQLYLEALLIKDQEIKRLENYSQRLYLDARDVLERDELLLPFSKFDKNADTLLDKSSNSLIKNLVLLYLKNNDIQVNEYKKKSNTYYFENPFKVKDDDSKNTYRNIVFDNEKSRESAEYEFVNITHPLIKEIRESINKTKHLGISSAFKIRLGKFQDIRGLLFYYLFFMTNNNDKNFKKLIPIFLVDGKDYNSRISNALGNLEYYETQIIKDFNYDLTNDINPSDKAFEEAKEIAQNIFFSKKNEWTEDLDNYKSKLEKFYNQKALSIKDIQIENIRKSKETNLKNEKEKEFNTIENKKKNIVPDIKLLQVAYLEII